MWPEAASPVSGVVRARLAATPKRPLVVGLCGAQGSGKSTICAAVAGDLAADGLRVAVLSLDDLYLPRAERERLGREVHPLLVTRGVPGTHDPALGRAILGALAVGCRVSLPRFDKARDDRRPAAEWTQLPGPVDVLLFEGWCLGARPQAEGALDLPENALEAQEDTDGRWRRYVNRALAGEYQTLFGDLDLLILLAAPDFAIVRRWRGEQEEALRQAGSGGGRVMDGASLDRFVQHYERLTRHILSEMPARADLVLRLDEARRVTGASARS